MKKINKLNINFEKLIKNEELLALKGGGYNPCTCLCASAFPEYHYCGYIVAPDGDCSSWCNELCGPHAWGECQ